MENIVTTFSVVVIIGDGVKEVVSHYFSYHLQMMTGLECGHRFCTQCWCEYLTTKIMDAGLVSIL